MELGLNGTVALVTGASRRIGAAIAAERAREGADVRLLARNTAKLNEVAAGITNKAAVRTTVRASVLRQPQTWICPRPVPTLGRRGQRRCHCRRVRSIGHPG